MGLSDAYDDLDGILGYEEPDEEPVLTGLDDANKALRRIARIRRARADDQQVADAEVARVTAWLASRKDQHAAAETFELQRLEHYHQALLEFDPKRKTISLPNGKLTARAQQPVWTFEDAVFIEWALVELVDALRIKPPEQPPPEVDKNAAKRLLTQERKDEKGRVLTVDYGLTAQNEKPPGVAVEIRGDKFDVEVSE